MEYKFTNPDTNEIILTEEHLKVEYAYRIQKGIMPLSELKIEHFLTHQINRVKNQLRHGYRVVFVYEDRKTLLIYNK